MSEKCACKGDYLDKFIQPAILALLCEGSAHGFYLLSELDRRGLASGVDAAGFYRTLHKLENDGKISSRWFLQKGEKPRQLYSISEAGRECLANWKNTLHSYMALIQRIYDLVEKQSV